MDEEQNISSAEAATGGGGATAVALAPAEQTALTFDINQLQTLAPSALQEFFAQIDFRPHPGHNRHQQILGFVRLAISRGHRVTVNGFLEQPNDGPAIIRSPQLNFLPVPEDVGMPHFLIRQFDLRPGQSVEGTIRLPRDREKTLILDRLVRVEEQPVAEWEASTAFDNLTALFPKGRIMLENEAAATI
ncbi:MAG: hypothetical protein ACREF8_01995, partial [Chthoniobacterales bacterium]